MKCQSCNSDMIKESKYWICEKCLKIVIVQDEITNINYNEYAINNFPTIIAHEYYRLKELDMAGESYGTFLQIKDMYEIILKFPVIIMIEGLIYSLKNEEICESGNRRNNILRLFIEKPLSLGDWENIASKIAELSGKELPKKNFELYRDTSKYLGEIIKLFKVKINNESKNISSWRNDYIAHGALSFDDSKFRDEIRIMINNINNIMKKSEKYYSNMELTDKDGQILKGHEIKHINEEDEILMRYDISSGDNNLILSPFVYTESYTYLFDSFSHYSNTAYRLNYSHGKKGKCYKSIDTLLELKKLLNLDELDNEGIDRENHLTLQLKKIEEILKNKIIIKPNYLNDYLMPRLGYGENKRSYNKGVFMIRAERGMGKTIFTKILDDLGDTSTKEKKPENYNKIIKRVYHINNTYGSQLSTFKHNLLNDLCSTFQTPNAVIGKIREEFSKLDFCNDLEKIKRQFARILNISFNELNKVYYKESGIKKEKFLLVIDGIDEFNYKYEEHERTIFDFIPRPDMLDEGIFILLTSRLHEELNDSERLQREIEEIKLTEPAEVITRSSSEGYVSLLYRHIDKNLKISDRKVQKELLESLDYRFSYLSAYERLYCSKLFSKGEIDHQNIIKSYLSYLENSNKRHYDNIKRLLLILAISPVGIRVDELCYLMNEDSVTYKLLGTINDLSNFIECKRELGVTVMSISHQDWKEDLIRNYKDDIQVLLEEYKKEFISFSNRLLQSPDTEGYVKFERDYDKFRGQFYILINYTIMNQLFNERNPVVLSDEDLRKNVETLYRILANLHISDSKKELLLAKINFLNGMAREIKRISEKNTNDDYILSAVHMIRGIELDKLNRLEEALKDHEKAIEIRKILYKKRKLPDKNDLAGVYMNRGVTLNNLNRLEEALEDYKKVIEVLGKKGKPQYRETLAKVYMNRGNVLNNLNRLEEALKDYKKAIEITEALTKECKVTDREALVGLYMNRGVAFDKLNRLEEALKDYEKAIEIIDALDKEGKLIYRKDLDKLYANRGFTLNNLNRLEEALKDYKKAIEIIEMLDKEGKLLNRKDLAKVYMRRGNTLNNLNHLEEALKDYEKAMKIMRELDKKGKLVHRNDLAALYSNRGIALMKLNRLEEGLENCEEGIKIMEILDKEEKLKYRNDLAGMYINRGTMFDNVNCLEDALNNYNKGIEIMEVLNKERKLPNRKILELVYEYRDDVLKRLNRL